jgi:uncharacterized membrane protein YfcA
MNIRMAAGSAKFINFTANASAIVVLLLSGKAVIVLGLVAAVFSMVANYIGSGMLIHKGTTIVRPIIIFVLLLFFVKVMYDMIAVA